MREMAGVARCENEAGLDGEEIRGEVPTSRLKYRIKVSA